MRNMHLRGDQARRMWWFFVLACLNGANLWKTCFLLLVEEELMDLPLVGVA